MRRALESSREEDKLWNEIAAHAGEEFVTAKGLTFSYTVRGCEIFVSRKEKSITRSTVNVAYRRAQELYDVGEIADGPKKLGTFGASYIYPIFIRIGVPGVVDGEKSDQIGIDEIGGR